MRRRRPSAVYSVLDEADLLGDVDLTDYPDPLAGESPADHGRDGCERLDPDVQGEPGEWWVDGDPGAGAGDEWSWDDGGSADGWSPADRALEGWSPAEGPEEWSPAEAAQPGGWSAERMSPGARRRGRRAAGLVAAVILILVVARVLGGLLGAAGERSNPGRSAVSTTVGALSAVSRPGEGSGRTQPTRPDLGARRSSGLIRSSSNRAGRRLPVAGSIRSTTRHAKADRPPATSRRPSVTNDSSQRVRWAALTGDSPRPSGGAPAAGDSPRPSVGAPSPRDSPRPWPRQSFSPEQEFGFER